MIETALVMMTLLGCADDARACDVIAQDQQVWSSQAACNAAIPARLEASIDAPYPILSARCDTIETATPPRDPLDLVAEMTPNVPIESPSVLATVAAWTASGAAPLAHYAADGWTVLRKTAEGGYTVVEGRLDAVWDLVTLN